MTVENISWSISTKECCRPRRGLNPQLPGLRSDGASYWTTEAGYWGMTAVVHSLCTRPTAVIPQWTSKIYNSFLKLISDATQEVPKPWSTAFLSQRKNRWRTNKTRQFKYIENFTTKSWKFSDKNSDFFFHISAQNIDCGCSVEPPRRGDLTSTQIIYVYNKNKINNIYPCKPSFYYIKSGVKGVKII